MLFNDCPFADRVTVIFEAAAKEAPLRVLIPLILQLEWSTNALLSLAGLAAIDVKYAASVLVSMLLPIISDVVPTELIPVLFKLRFKTSALFALAVPDVTSILPIFIYL